MSRETMATHDTYRVSPSLSGRGTVPSILHREHYLYKHNISHIYHPSPPLPPYTANEHKNIVLPNQYRHRINTKCCTPPIFLESPQPRVLENPPAAESYCTMSTLVHSHRPPRRACQVLHLHSQTPGNYRGYYYNPVYTQNRYINLENTSHYCSTGRILDHSHVVLVQ